MSPALQAQFSACDQDYQLVAAADINADFFADYSNIRIVNSFLFNFSKLQDKIGAQIPR